MKTMRWLKISVVLQAIFVFFSVASILCFGINHYFDTRILGSIGEILAQFWILNPVAPVTLIVGLILYFAEKRDEENRLKIGRKWLWFIVLFAFDVLLYLTSAVLLVALTGGI